MKPIYMLYVYFIILSQYYYFIGGMHSKEEYCVVVGDSESDVIDFDCVLLQLFLRYLPSLSDQSANGLDDFVIFYPICAH